MYKVKIKNKKKNFPLINEVCNSADLCAKIGENLRNLRETNIPLNILLENILRL
jgi:hypothetical protein